MDRQIVYAGQVPLETDILNTNQNAFLALGKLATALFGANTAVNGFGCTPTAPASLQVNVGAGEVYTVQSVDNSAYSSLPADTSHQITKQGIALDNTTIKITPPTTSGQSINYLVQVAFTETDSGAKVLQYYNSANPAQSFSGAGNSGAVQPTVRQNTCVVGLKSGGAGATGSQTTPAPDAGYVGLWVITVATGQSAITASNISPYAYAPFVNSGLLGLSPAFSVSPTAPTPPIGDKSNKVATMAALQTVISNHGTQTIYSSTTFTVPDGVTKLFITGCAGGGGGAGGGGATNGGAGGGGGGGAGQVSIKTAYTVTPNSTLTITVGAGGNGGTGGDGTPSNGANGIVGGNTVVTGTGVNLTLQGGQAGQYGVGASGGKGQFGGAGGNYGAGNGGFGYHDGYNSVIGGGGGAGGGAGLGGGGTGGQNTGAPANGAVGSLGTGFGAGGGGGAGGATTTSTTQTGGNGANGLAGLVILEW